MLSVGQTAAREPKNRARELTMRTYRGTVQNNKVLLPEGTQLREGSIVTVLVPDEADDDEPDEGLREALFRQDLKDAGLVLDPRPANRRPSARERHLIEVAGEPLSQFVIRERG
jgi:hypothetical protein